MVFYLFIYINYFFITMLIIYVTLQNSISIIQNGLLDGEEFVLDLTPLLYKEINGEKVLTCKPGDILTFHTSLNNEGYISIEPGE